MGFGRWGNPKIWCHGAEGKMTHLKITPELICAVSSGGLVFFVDRLCDQLTFF